VFCTDKLRIRRYAVNMQKSRKTIPANEQTIALLIGMLQIHEQQIHELEIANQAFLNLFQHLDLIPEFHTQWKVAQKIARRQISAPKPNKVESTIRAGLDQAFHLATMKKQKPN
jgi:predicted O-linked N-acetylglucosamine transferase (SPINDLY family)